MPRSRPNGAGLNMKNALLQDIDNNAATVTQRHFHY